MVCALQACDKRKVSLQYYWANAGSSGSICWESPTADRNILCSQIPSSTKRRAGFDRWDGRHINYGSFYRGVAWNHTDEHQHGSGRRNPLFSRRYIGVIVGEEGGENELIINGSQGRDKVFTPRRLVSADIGSLAASHAARLERLLAWPARERFVTTNKGTRARQGYVCTVEPNRYVPAIQHAMIMDSLP